MGLITFITSFISLFVSIIPEPILDESPFTNFLPIILSFVSTTRLSFNSLESIFFNPFSYKFDIELSF